MPIVVEDGTGLETANAYVSIAEVQTYAAERGLAFASSVSLQEQAIVRATSYLDARYRSRYDGLPRRLREQALAWPRSNAHDAEGTLIYSGAVPREVKAATSECAIRELALPGALSPDQERGGAIKSLKAGSVAIEYADGATAETIFKTIDQALSGLLPVRVSGAITFGKVVRR